MGGIVESIAGPIIGGLFGADSADTAADAQGQSAALASQTQRDIFERQVQLSKPWRDTGEASLNRLADLLGVSGRTNAAGYGSAARDFGMSDFQKDPGYQFRQDEGMKALERSAAGRGGLNSGRSMKDTLRFSQGLASDEYGRAFDRFQVARTNKLNPLQSLAGVGQTATNALGQAASNYGNAVSGIQTGLGNAQGAAALARGSAYTNAIGQGMQAYQTNQLLQQLQRPNSWSAGWGSAMNSGGAYG